MSHKRLQEYHKEFEKKLRGGEGQACQVTTRVRVGFSPPLISDQIPCVKKHKEFRIYELYKIEDDRLLDIELKTLQIMDDHLEDNLRLYKHRHKSMIEYYKNKLEMKKLLEEPDDYCPIPKKHYKYFVTFTLSNENKHKEKEQIRQLNKILNSKIFAIEKHEYGIERTKAGVQHIHLYCETMKYIRKSEIVRRYYPSAEYGTIDCQKVKNKDAVIKYVNKEKNTTEIIFEEDEEQKEQAAPIS